MEEIEKDFPSVSPRDTSERVGQRNNRELDDAINAFVRRNMANYAIENPNATDDELANYEEEARDRALRIIESYRGTDPDAVEAQHHGQERLEAAKELGEDAVENEVELVPEGQGLTGDELESAQIEAYAMDPYMTEIAKDKAANPKRYVGENGRLAEKGGLTPELKQKHWKLEGQAKYDAKEALRMREYVNNSDSDPYVRKVAHEALDGYLKDAPDHIPYKELGENAYFENESPAATEQPEEFDFDKWLKQHEDGIDKEQDSSLRATLKKISEKLNSKYTAARKGELPEADLAALIKSGRAAVNITANIIEGYFNSDFIKGLEEHGYDRDRKGLKELFAPIASNSNFGSINEHGRFIADEIDIVEDPYQAVILLRHAYNNLSRDDPKAIMYGVMASNILRTLQDKLCLKVPEEKKSAFEGLIRSLQMNEEAISQVR